MIYSVWLPASIKYGISYSEFMLMNPKIMNVYQNSYIDKQKEQNDLMNISAWIQGQYNLYAIASSINKRVRFPAKPFEFKNKGQDDGFTPEEKFLLWVDEFNRRFEANS